MDQKLSTLNSSIASQRIEGDAKRSEQVIATALGLHTTAPFRTTAWQQVETLRASLVPGTGEWLRGEETFVAWAGASSPHPLLVLEGGNGSGKTSPGSQCCAPSLPRGQRRQARGRVLCGVLLSRRRGHGRVRQRRDYEQGLQESSSGNAVLHMGRSPSP